MESCEGLGYGVFVPHGLEGVAEVEVVVEDGREVRCWAEGGSGVRYGDWFSMSAEGLGLVVGWEGFDSWVVGWRGVRGEVAVRRRV